MHGDPPAGMGVYLRHLPHITHEKPASAARRAAKHGLSFAALMGPWHDHRGVHPPARVTAEYARALQGEGVEVWIWGYPHPATEDRWLDEMTDLVRDCGAAGWILDVELPYKHKPIATERLCENVIDRLDESTGLGITSYGRLDWHGLEPLASYGWHSPQVYTVPIPAARAALQSWGGDTLVPSVPAYGPNSGARLDEYLDGLAEVDDVIGFLVWSWPQISDAEWLIIQRWAERFRG